MARRCLPSTMQDRWFPKCSVDGDAYAVVRRRPTFEEMTALERLPDWLS